MYPTTYEKHEQKLCRFLSVRPADGARLSVSNTDKISFGYKHPASQLEDGEYLAVVTAYPRTLYDVDIPSYALFKLCKGELVFLCYISDRHKMLYRLFGLR